MVSTDIEAKFHLVEISQDSGLQFYTDSIRFITLKRRQLLGYRKVPVKPDLPRKVYPNARKGGEGQGEGQGQGECQA